MEKKIKIKTKNQTYNIAISDGSAKKYLKKVISLNSKIFLVIDNKISNEFKSITKKRNNVFVIRINGSEKIKSIDTYWKIINSLLEKKIDRNSKIVAIGGGTVGDLCGFISSTVLRGIEFVLIPSTLLSQVDSSIGGKNGINSKHGKNLIGTFYHPNKVIIDPSLLKTLPKNQLKSGYAEIVKHALINDKYFFNWLKKNYKKVLSLKRKELIYAIDKSIRIKAKFVSRDEKENLINTYSRSMLNFGHTFGHALETLNKYSSKLLHGEAISIGMVLASKISYKFNDINKFELEEIINHFSTVGLPTETNKIKSSIFYRQILSDKKNTNNEVNLILLKNVGKAYFKRKMNIEQIKNLIN